jgi:hypothetical protein
MANAVAAPERANEAKVVRARKRFITTCGKK